jgi:uncharacterized protein (DUF1800 family)
LKLPLSAETLGPRERALHLLNRLGFGARPGDIDRVAEAGVVRAFEQALAPEPEPALDARLEAFPGIERTIDEIVKEHQRLDFSRAPIEEALDHLRSAKLVRAVHSENQLVEVMVDFWYNHFNVYSYAWEPSTGVYEKEAIRPHVFTDFRTLLGASAKHPAMLFYLDNYLNVADRTVDGQLVRGINENFGRELLELHTVGVDAGYTQGDVQAAARALTGWDFGGWGVYKYSFREDKHDGDAKTIFGLELPAGGGREEGERLLDYLSAHPKTARFVSWRLVQRFVADDPPASLVDRCAAVFLATKGDVKSLLQTIVESEEFWLSASVGQKTKTPFEFVASALRAVSAEVRNGSATAAALGNMGMPLYGCRPPTGYSNHGQSWLSAASQVYRFDYAFKLAAGQVPGITVPERLGVRASGDDAKTLSRAMAREVLAGRARPKTLKVASKVRADASVGVLTKVAGLLLASPEFQMR